MNDDNDGPNRTRAQRDLARVKQLFEEHYGQRIDDVVGATHFALSQRRLDDGQITKHAVRLSSTLVHQLRNQLSALTLQLQRVSLNGRLNTAQKSLIDRCQANAKQMGELISSVLDLTAIESGERELAVSAFDVMEVVASIVNSLQPWAEAEGVAIALVTTRTASVMFRSDAQLLKLLLTNLIENAIKYSDHGSVQVGVVGGDDELRVVVSDDGPGVEPQDRLRIFDTGERLPGLTEEGHGIGLALVRRATEALGGRVEVTSDRGARFELVLPAAQ